MVKLQQVKRKDGTHRYMVNLPLDVIEDLSWKKGDELDVEQQDSEIKISKKEEQDGRIDNN